MAGVTPSALQRSAYLLPSLFTVFNLVCGLAATVVAAGGVAGAPAEDLAVGAWFVLAAMVFDFLDGKVARWVHAETEAGVRIDSLADFVSFGVAPVLLAQAAWFAGELAWAGWLAGGAFILAGAWRLARFNCEHGEAGVNHFTGLPIPAAAAWIAALVLVDGAIGPRMSWTLVPWQGLAPLALAAMAGLAGLMASRLPFPAFKRLNRRNALLLAGLMLFVGVLTMVMPARGVILAVMTVYLCFGLFRAAVERVLQPRFRPGTAVARPAKTSTRRRPVRKGKGV